MKKLILLGFSAIISLGILAQNNPKTNSKTNPKKAHLAMVNLIDSFSYAAGINVARNMKEQHIPYLNTALMSKAIEDVFGNKTSLLTDEQVNSCLQRQLDVFTKEQAAEQKAKGLASLEANKKNKDVVVLPNGMQYQVIKPGNPGAEKPKAVDTVVVSYIGTFPDGKEFDNSYQRGQPAVFPLTGVIRGWTEILQLMTVGAQWKVFIPSELAYGETGGGGGVIPPNSVLVFDISLEGIKPAVPVEAPKN